MNLLNRDFRQMKIAGQHTPFWGGQHGRFLHLVEIFPNPTEGEINIKTELERFDFEIINLDGHMVMSGSGDHSFTLPMNEIPSGLYFITIKNEDYQFNQKIIKL